LSLQLFFPSPTACFLTMPHRKMVNVNAAFPFNLHNQSLGDPPSHSVSGRTLDSSWQASRSPTRHLLHTRYSSTSLQWDAEGSASRSNDAVEGRGDLYKPILNVRLVSTPASNSANRTINGISRGWPGCGIKHGRVMVVSSVKYWWCHQHWSFCWNHRLSDVWWPHRSVARLHSHGHHCLLCHDHLRRNGTLAAHPRHTSWSHI
jgi:hypothetical protein